MPGPTQTEQDCPAYQAGVKQIQSAKTMKQIDRFITNAHKIINLAQDRRTQLLREADVAQARIDEIKDAE